MLNVVSMWIVLSVFLQLIYVISMLKILFNKMISVVPLQQFCLSKIDQFKCCETFTNTLVQLERQRILVQKGFHKTIELWTKPEVVP